MKRYIKVNNKWIDTLEAIKSGICYYQIDNKIYRLINSEEDEETGVLQEESDTPVKDPLKEFFELYPHGGYKRYKAWCQDKPLTKREFKRYKL